jgi:hypothetical protein
VLREQIQVFGASPGFDSHVSRIYVASSDLMKEIIGRSLTPG